MRLLTCLVVWALFTVGYAQGVLQAAAPTAQPQPNVAARPVNNGYWYRAVNGRWYWHAGARAAAAPVAQKAAPARVAAVPQQARTTSTQLDARYSYDPNQPTSEQLRNLQQEVLRLQRSMDQLQAPQNQINEFLSQDWFSRQQRGSGGSDPALFQ